MTTEHLDSDLVAAYGERRLSPGERSRVEAHVADCDECRRELAGFAIELAAARRRRRAVVAGPALAAAGLAAVMLWGGPGSTGSPDPVLRPGSGAGDTPPPLPAWLPAAGGPVTRQGLRFVWGSDGPDALYDLTVADSAGLVVWRARTSDTVTALPDTVMLAPGRYHWWVDVLLPDGRVASTGNREFVVAP